MTDKESAANSETLCNTQQLTCIANANDSCDSLDKNKSAVKSNLLDAILKQFDAKYEISKLDLENNLKVNYVYYKQNIYT